MLKKIAHSLRDIIGKKHEVTDSIREALEDRVVSPFYGYFVISWLLVNWNYIYVALFTSNDSVLQQKDLLRNEYLFQYVLPAHLSSWTYWLDFLIIPFAFTCIAFWIMPSITRIFFRQHIRNKIKNEEIRSEEMAAEIQAETNILKAEVEQAKARENARETDPTILWRQEYEEFRSHRLYGKFSQIIESIYTYSGWIEYETMSDNFSMDRDILVYADVNGLVIRLAEDNKIELTEKGKEFVKHFSNEKG